MRPYIALIAACIFNVSTAQAEIVARQVVEQEVAKRSDDGRVLLERVKAETVAPGEEVIYTVQFENKGSDPAGDLVMVMPVPTEITYVEGSASGTEATISFSADGGKSYLARGRLTVKEDGVDRAATGDEITHIKWALANPVPTNSSGEIFFRGILK